MNHSDEAERPEQGTEDERPRMPAPGRWSSVMEELIEEAMRNGSFDNLPGRGKPLNLSTNPYSPETELAFQLLKNNRYTLPWIAERNALLDQIDGFRRQIGDTGRFYQTEYRVARSELIRQSLIMGWREQLVAWQAKIDLLNKRIADLNLKQPEALGLEIVKLTLARELARAGFNEELGSAAAP
jgi:DnaJ homolog subfamily C member 28